MGRMEILGSALKHGFGSGVVLKFLSVLQLHDFWEVSADSLPLFLNVYFTVFPPEYLFSKQIHCHHISDKRCFDLGLWVNSVGNPADSNGVFRGPVQNVFALVTEKGWDISFLQKKYDVISATWLLLESSCWYLYQTKLGWANAC